MTPASSLLEILQSLLRGWEQSKILDSFPVQLTSSRTKNPSSVVPNMDLVMATPPECIVRYLRLQCLLRISPTYLCIPAACRLQRHHHYPNGHHRLDPIVQPYILQLHQFYQRGLHLSISHLYQCILCQIENNIVGIVQIILLPLTSSGQMTPAPRFKHWWLSSWGHWEILSSVPAQFALFITVGGRSRPTLVSIATTVPTACARYFKYNC